MQARTCLANLTFPAARPATANRFLPKVLCCLLDKRPVWDPIRTMKPVEVGAAQFSTHRYTQRSDFRPNATRLGRRRLGYQRPRCSFEFVGPTRTRLVAKRTKNSASLKPCYGMNNLGSTIMLFLLPIDEAIPERSLSYHERQIESPVLSQTRQWRCCP